MPEDDETLDHDAVEKMKEEYLHQLIVELDTRKTKLTPEQQELRTIYIWWWTPFQLWPKRLHTLLDHIVATRDVSFLEELSIELNPDPFDEVIGFIRDTWKRYKNISRVRFSIGIQSFDDEILEKSGRQYVYLNLINFLREIAEVKMHHMVYNLDFIAFGDLYRKQKNPEEKFLPWRTHQREFFEKVAKSQMFDGMSLYSLELFPWSERYYQAKDAAHQMSVAHTESWDQTKWDEFSYIKKVLMDAGMQRYEISNFSLSSKRSIHNHVYRDMWSYLGIGINASGMLAGEYAKTISDTPSKWLRYKNTTHWKKYLAGEFIDEESLQLLDETERDIESCLLWLRTSRGIYIEKYRHVLVDNADEIVAQMIKDKYASLTDNWRLVLTSKWMDVYNAVIMELMKEV